MSIPNVNDSQKYMQKAIIKEKINQCKLAIYKINYQNIKLGVIIKRLDSAKVFLENGGYIDEDGTIDRGVLKQTLETLGNTKDKFKKLIYEIQQEIASLYNQYNSIE